MLRTDLAASADNLLDALEHSNLIESLLAARDSKSGKNLQIPQLLMNSLNDFSIQSQNFVKAERKLLHCYNCEKLLDPSEWVNILPHSASEDVIYELYADLVDLRKFLLNFRTLVLPKYQPRKDADWMDVDDAGDRAILTVILSEEGDKNSSPDRFMQLFEAIKLFYDAFAMLEKRKTKIVLAGCDSGNEKSFDFLGETRIITLMKELILELWDRVMFNREKQLDTRIDVISKALLIFDCIGELEKKQTLNPVEARTIREHIQQGVIRFIATGATIPEMNEHTTFIPRKLMTPQPKLVPDSNATPPVEGKAAKQSGKAEKSAAAVKDDFEETGFSIITDRDLNDFLDKSEKEEQPAALDALK